jgi:lycopene beta-cyclase
LRSSYQYIIQGAGASGLWLAYWLDQFGLLQNHHLLIAEGDLNKVNDRTWCFWTPIDEAEFPFVDKRWTSLRVQNANQVIDPYAYCHTRSQDFYGWVKNKLSQNPNIHWYKGYIEQATASQEYVEVQTAEGKLQAQYFFRSGQLTDFQGPDAISLWQSFVGWRIRLDEGTWDTKSATLMDFSVPQAHATRFLYVLPIAENEGLVEVTQFHASPLTVAEGEEMLAEICKERGWKCSILEVECNAIPMSSVFNQTEKVTQSNARIIPIGVAAGALKPTTGYGFLAMRKHARELAIALKNKKPLPTIYRKRRFRFYDALLLHMLSSTPHRGKAIFERLFSRQPATRILKFLDEKTSIWEELRIFSRLQVSWFLKALLTYGKD